MKNSPLVVIVGPTASGKTALALRIAKAYNGEVIAADSRTVYRGMDIGTAKPTAEEQQAIRHHLIGIRDPEEAFSAAEFKKLALEAIDDIASRGKVSVLVGGTGLYVDAVIFDYKFGSVADAEYRAELNKLTIEELQVLCRQKDIEVPINSKNKRHLIRAIEMGGLMKQEKSLRPNTFVVGISIEREKLRERIAQRAQDMVAQGVLGEVEQVGRKYSWKGEALKGNIYRVFRGVVEGTKTVEEAEREFIQSDLDLAKRQMTWFKRNPHIEWSDSSDDLFQRVSIFLQRVKY